jgi:hypothetical protein
VYAAGSNEFSQCSIQNEKENDEDEERSDRNEEETKVKNEV